MEERACRLIDKCRSTSASPTDEEILEILRLLVFSPNERRAHLSDEQVAVPSFTLGMSSKGLTYETKLFTALARALIMWLEGQQFWLTGLKFTNIQVNGSYRACRHRDANNVGPSVIKAIGDYEGGKLLIWPEDPGGVDIFSLGLDQAQRVDPRQWYVFYGTQAHETESFQGERFSLVYYESTIAVRTGPDADRAKQLGFVFE